MTPIVFLHGFLGAPSDWDELDRHLPVATPRQRISLPLADDWHSGVQRTAAHLPTKFILVGYSLGARVALAVALAYPTRLRGLCLVSGHPGLDDSERTARRAHDQDVAQRLLTQPPTRFLEDWYRQEIFSSIDQATRTSWIRQKQALNQNYQARLLRCYSIAEQPDYWPQLSNIAARTLVVVGERDKKYVDVARRMKRQAPKIEVHVVPSVGHAVHREHPEALGTILRTFVVSLPLEKTCHE